MFLEILSCVQIIKCMFTLSNCIILSFTPVLNLYNFRSLRETEIIREKINDGRYSFIEIYQLVYFKTTAHFEVIHILSFYSQLF